MKRTEATRTAERTSPVFLDKSGGRALRPYFPGMNCRSWKLMSRFRIFNTHCAGFQSSALVASSPNHFSCFGCEHGERFIDLKDEECVALVVTAAERDELASRRELEAVLERPRRLAQLGVRDRRGHAPDGRGTGSERLVEPRVGLVGAVWGVGKQGLPVGRLLLGELLGSPRLDQLLRARGRDDLGAANAWLPDVVTVPVAVHHDAHRAEPLRRLQLAARLSVMPVSKTSVRSSSRTIAAFAGRRGPASRWPRAAVGDFLQAVVLRSANPTTVPGQRASGTRSPAAAA
jgi:hypothetical protein